MIHAADKQLVLDINPRAKRNERMRQAAGFVRLYPGRPIAECAYYLVLMAWRPRTAGERPPSPEQSRTRMRWAYRCVHRAIEAGLIVRRSADGRSAALYLPEAT